MGLSSLRYAGAAKARSGSELKAACELQSAHGGAILAADDIGDETGVGIDAVDAIVRAREISVVEHVECLRGQLQPYPFRE